MKLKSLILSSIEHLPIDVRFCNALPALCRSLPAKNQCVCVVHLQQGSSAS